MSETTTPTALPEVSTPAPAASPEPTPAGSSPAAEPTTVSVVSPATEPSVEPAAAAFTPHTDTPTILEEIGKKPELKAVEAAPETADPAKPAEPVEPAPEPIVYDFKLPEGTEADASRMEAYTSLLQEARMSPEHGQKLLDMHHGVIRQMAENHLAQQHEDFAAMRREWKERSKSDPLIGGAGRVTAERAMARARDAIVPPEDADGWNEMLRLTGAGDHPALQKALYRLANIIDEPVAPSQAPLPTASPQGPAPRRGVHALFNGKASNSFASR